MERGQRERLKVDEGRIQLLVRGFADDWKRSIEALNAEVMQSFSNFKTGTYILQVCERGTLVAMAIIINAYVQEMWPGWGRLSFQKL